jgi:TP901-1 family phage major tail protein
MASTGAINGTAVVLKIGGTTIAKLKSNSLKLSRNAIDISNKDSGGWKESIYGQGSGSFDFEGVFAEDGTWGFDEAYAAISGKTNLTAKWTAGAGDLYYQASCILTSISMTAPMEDAVTFSGSLEITGAPTTGTL